MTRLFAYFPCLIVATLFIWPNIMIQMRLGEFPVIMLAGFSIRLTELLMFCFFVFMLIIMPLKENKDAEGMFNSVKLRSLYPYLTCGLVLFVIAGIQGYLANNPILLLDLRGLSYGIFPLLFIFFVRTVDDFRKPFLVFYILIFILASANLFSRLVPSLHFIQAGKYSNLTVMLSLYFLCISIALWQYYNRYKLLYLSIIIFSLVCCLASFQKQVYLACLMIFLGAIIFAQKNKRKSVLKMSLFLSGLTVLFFFVLVNSNIYETIFHKTFSDYIYERIMRESVGDVSSGRFAMWSDIITDALRHPFWGNGLGVIGFYDRMISILINEHNIVMWSIRRVGIFGTIVFLIIVLKFYKFMQFVFKNEKTNYNKMLLYASFMYLPAYCSVNLVILTQFTFEPAVIFWLNIGIILLIYRDQLSE